jgi:hypothetical protein
MCLSWKSEDELCIAGKSPSGRYDHEMKKFKNTLILFGGRKINRDKPFSSGIYILQLSTLTWIKLQQASGLANRLFFNVSEFSSIIIKNDKI